MKSDGLALALSVTPREPAAHNQDAVNASFSQAIVVADGIGSSPDAGIGARVAVAAATRLLRAGRKIDARLFAEIQATLSSVAARIWNAKPSGERARISDRSAIMQTTLLVARQTERSLEAGYLGNGALYHIRGAAVAEATNVMLPWGWVDLLNPHSRDEQGREALTNYIAPDKPHLVQPTCLSINKASCGDMLLLATDGLHSADQCERGFSEDERFWIGVETPMLRVAASIAEVWNGSDPITRAGMQAALTGCLHNLNAAGQLQDDTSIGLLITPEALSFREAQGRLRG